SSLASLCPLTPPSPTTLSTLSLHDALPIYTTSTNNGSHTLTAVATDLLGVPWNSNPITVTVSNGPPPDTTPPMVPTGLTASAVRDRKSTRLNSSHVSISYAVFCLKKKKKK